MGVAILANVDAPSPRLLKKEDDVATFKLSQRLLPATGRISRQGIRGGDYG